MIRSSGSSRPGGALGIGIAILVFSFGLASWFEARLVSSRPTWFVEDREGGHLGEIGHEDRLGSWPLDEVPLRLRQVTLAAEDRRFAWHPGVDPGAILRAGLQNLFTGRRVSGASTLAMQVARMQDPGPRTLGKKIREAWKALFLTARFGREAILRHYLQIAPYGHRIRGIGYAARRYLAKPLEDLSWAELCLLTAIPQSPRLYDLETEAGVKRACNRALRILGCLRREGWISKEVQSDATRELQGFQPVTPPRRPLDSLHFLMRFAGDYRDDPRGIRFPGRRRLVTTLDPKVQGLLARAAGRWMGNFRARGAGNCALVVVDLKSREVLGYLGSKDYFETKHSGSIDFLTVPRPSGSTLKPFLYSLALDRGVLKTYQVLEDLRPAATGISNSDQSFLGPFLPRVMLGNSRNVPLVDLIQKVGLERFARKLEELELNPGTLPPDHYGVGLAIGSLPVCLLDLVQAYGAIADGSGVLRPLRVLREPEAAPSLPAKAVFSPRSVQHVRRFLADAQARIPTFRRMGSLEYPFTVGIKTGTSARYRDSWTVAFSDQFLVGAWVGHPSAAPMAGLSGGMGAAVLVKDVLQGLHPERLDGLSEGGFPAPVGTVSLPLCPRSGGLAGDSCPEVLFEDVPYGAPALPACSVHRVLSLDRRTGQGATGDTPAEALIRRAATVWPLSVADWAQKYDPESFLKGAEVLLGQTSQEDTPRLVLVRPEPGLRLRLDPETPPGESSVELRVLSFGFVPEVHFFVDETRVGSCKPPCGVRWPLELGEHRIRVEDASGQISTPPRRLDVRR